MVTLVANNVFTITREAAATVTSIESRWVGIGMLSIY